MNESEKWNDNQEAHKAINECLQIIGERLQALEQYVQEIPTPDKTFYRPKGAEEHLNVKGNYDEIYSRIERLEERLNGM